MQYKLLYRTILSILLTTATASIIAQPTLSLNTQAGMAGQQVTATLAITEPGSSSGFNAHIVLPIGVTLIAVNKGDLVSSSAFTLDYHQLNQDLKVIAYSATEAITQAGELLTLILQINNTVVPSLLDLSFSNINSNSLINSKHALSSNDGLSSLAHSVENTKIVVYNTTSDQDGDGMTDQWEISNGLNPFINDAGGDLDGDEYSNLQEFQNGTDPDDNTDFPINNENCGGADVSISDHTYSSLANETCTASTRIATSGNILVSSGASVIYNAPSIILNPGFRVTLGGYFRAEQNPQAAQRVLNNPSETSTQEVNSVVQTIEFSEEDNIEITSPIELFYLYIKNTYKNFATESIEFIQQATERYVVFATEQALSENDFNSSSDVYLFDAETGGLLLLSPTLSSTGTSTYPSIDAAGHYVAFQSTANDLTIDDNNPESGVYLYSIQDMTLTRLANPLINELLQLNTSEHPSIESNGRSIVYDHADSQGIRQIYQYKMDEQSTVPLTSTNEPALESHHPVLSNDGRYLAYLATPLVTEADNAACYIHVLDLMEGMQWQVDCPVGLDPLDALGSLYFVSETEQLEWQSNGILPISVTFH